MLVKSITDQAKTSYVVDNLTASTTYYFTVRVVDTGGAFSDSNRVNGTTLPTPVILNKPTNPTPVSLDLSWTRNKDLNFKQYEIYKSTSSGELGMLVATIYDQSITTYKVTGLEPSTTYYFVIRVVNPQGLFSNSNQVWGVTATADFTLSIHPSSQVIIPGETATYTINVSSQWSFPVHLTISELSKGITASFNPQIVTPNGTSLLRITTSTSARGSYTLTVTGRSGELTRAKTITIVIIEININDVKQEKTGTITFSLTKTIEGSRSFSIEGVTITLSASADISLTMPVEVIAKSNATRTENSAGAWLIITMNGKTATIKVTLKVTVAVADLSQSITKTWTTSFTSPLGTSEATFDKFSIPAIDTLIGKVTIDLTPRVILNGYIYGNITIIGPGVVNKPEVQWTDQAGKNIVFITFKENKDVEVDLSSTTLTLTKINIVMDIEASLRTIIGSKSYSLGSLQLPISINIPTKGSPDAITLAKFSGSKTSPFEGLLPTELWIYIIVIMITIIITITAAFVWKKRHKATTVT